MRVIIAGSREIFDRNWVIGCIIRSGFEVSEIVSGGARGVDKLAMILAEDCDIPLKVFPAYWDKYGKQAGFFRNQEMAEYADALVACWDGKSKGTMHMINIMKKLGKPYKVYIKG
jgi:hypothetical protein